MNKTEKYQDKEWEDLAAMLSGEKGEEKGLPLNIQAEDFIRLNEQWKELGNMEKDEKIDVDKAWAGVYSRIVQENQAAEKPVRSLNTFWLKIAATALLLLAVGSAAIYFGTVSRQIRIIASSEQRNLPIDLPDGSKIYLNRNSSLSYRSDLGKTSREVRLKGEAFFMISPDAEKPFIIDAGKADVKVVGTSFSVITENDKAEVEVFVKTGKVLLSDKSGVNSLTLDPGFIGKMNSEKSEKTQNIDPNYLSWNTGVLDYTKGQKLEIVFSDLKKVYNMDIVADDPSILENRWSSYIDNQPQDKIILLICTSFNLSYTKEGNVYHLTGK
jgi:ferric-dicitrate binding protein FerR (iron transport regulator)